MEYSFSSIEEQEAHFELTQDTVLRKERAEFIAQPRIGGKMERLKTGYKKQICPNCGKEIIIEEWQDEDDCYCSSECWYEFETGHPGEEY